MSIPQFGRKEPGVTYQDRPGVYAIISDTAGRIAAIESDGRLFLPGGGIDLGETKIDALHREILEETGWIVKIGSFLGKADEYVYSVNKDLYINKRGSFYAVTIVSHSKKPSGFSPSPLWVTPDRFACGAAHQSHIWVIREFLKQK